MDRMQPMVFRGVNDARIEEVPKPRPGAGQGGHSHPRDDDLRHRGARPAGMVTILNGDFQGLPSVVERCLRHVIPTGRPLPEAVILKQRGTFLLNGVWRPFTAVERYSAGAGELQWNARIRVAPFVDVHVRDGWTRRAGSIRATLAGLIPIVRQTGNPMLDMGSLQRYLAEAPWLPIALLRRYGVSWEDVDDTRACARLSVPGISVALEFTFDSLEGCSVFTPGRPRELKRRYELTPWRGRFWNYAERCGMRIPLDGEVAWIVDGDSQPYWRGTIVDMQAAS